MTQETIVFTQGIVLPPAILELAYTMKPVRFRWHHLPPETSPSDIAAAWQTADYVMGFLRFLPDEAFTRAARLKLVQVLSAGYDRVNIGAARTARIPVCTNGGANAVAVAEHTIMLILAVYRKLVTYHQNVVAGRWLQGLPRAVDLFELQGKTVGLVGLGRIGEEVTRRLAGFETTVLYYDVMRRHPEEEARLGVQYVPLDTLLATADVVTLHVPLNDTTRGLIDAAALARMKPEAILINTCRGEVVQEEALIEALRTNAILGAGLDTQAQEPPDPANPLLQLPNVTLTPHSAGPTVDSFRKRFQNAYVNIERVADGQPPLWVIPEMHDLFPGGVATSA